MKVKTRFLQIRIIDHCNLNCKRCGSICNKRIPFWEINIEKYEQDLERMKELLPDIGKIKLLGGEPLLHSKINEVFMITRRYYTESIIELATNGLLIPKLNKEVLREIKKQDILVNISEYEPVSLHKREIESILCEYGIKYAFNVVDNFFVQRKLNFGSDIQKAHQVCLCRNCLDLRDGILRRCSALQGFNNLNNQFHTHYEAVYGEDYVNIYDSEYDIDSILEIFSRPGHMCGYCVDTELDWHEWEVDGSEPTLSDYVLVE